jgi:PAS domain S-box-containing protein
MTLENSNIELIKTLNENIKNPFIAVSPEGNIISYNKRAAELFKITDKTGNIFDFFEDNTSLELGKLFEDVLSGRKSVVKNMILAFTDGPDFKCQTTISEFNQSILFCTFRPEEHHLKINEITKLKIKKDELSSMLGNSRLEEIIDSVRESFPFTVLGKEKIRRDIDRLEELFWIKNKDGVFVLVNKSLAVNLGLNSSQLEGKSEEDLMPGYLRQVYISLENYIKESNNVIVFEGIPIQGLSAVSNFRTIEIPLNDSEGNLSAVIGISQRVEQSVPEKIDYVKENILENIPAPVVIIDNDGIVKHSSKEFCKLFSDEFSDLRGLSYTNIFPLEISEKIKKFLDSLAGDEEFRIKLSRTGEWKDRELLVYLRRNRGEKKPSGGLSIFFEDISPYTDLEKIISRRGKMYEVLIQNNPEPIFIYEKENLRFIEVNQAALNLYGYRRDEFLQMDLTDLYTPEDIQTLLDSSSGGIKEGVFTGPYRHKRKNGESVFVEISKISLKFNNKDAHFNVVKDVTKTLENEKQKMLFKAAFDNASNLIFITDSSGFIKSVNSVAAEKLNITDTDLIDTSFASLVKDDDRGIMNSKIFHSQNPQNASFKTSLKKTGGEMLEVELRTSPVINYKNEVESYVLVIIPESGPPAEAEQKIKEIIVEKIVEKEAGSSDKIDPAFLSGIFHEILTPINAMLGFVQELTDSIDDKTEEQEEAKDIIDQNRRRLLSTMNSVIEYSRMQQEPSDLEIKECSITEIVDDTQEEISDILKNKGIEFAYGKISSSLNFRTDSQKFISLITLLFKIASQFTSTRKIYFSAYQADDRHFLISIQDNYSSMSPSFSENFNNIFNKRKFQKDYGSSKLAVELARNLIDLLQGRFVDSSNRNPGFIFPLEPELEIEEEKPSETFKEKEITDTTPVYEEETVVEDAEQEWGYEDESEETQPEAEPEIQEEPEEEVKSFRQTPQRKKTNESISSKSDFLHKSKIDLSQLSCLYIEDQVDSQILFKVQLKELSQIKFAVSFEESLPLLDSNHFDFIVLDINLQGEYNGLDALKIIHRMAGYEDIPIIAVTAYVLPGDREKFIAAGFDDFISKPIFREKMVDSLEKIFSLMRS